MKIAIIGMAISGKLRKSYIAWIYKNPGIHPSYKFCDFTSKMADLGRKLKFWNFSEFGLSISLGHLFHNDHAHSRIPMFYLESMLGCYRWMSSQNISNLSIIFNITGKRDERPLLNLLAKLNPACIYLSPNIPNHVTSGTRSSRPDQENRVNPLFLVRNHNHL